MFLPKSVFFLGFVVFVSANALAETNDINWNGWLGPQRNGWVKNVQRTDWPNDLKKSWSVEVGTGYGTPLVVDGLVYQHGRKGASECVMCIELATGKVRWEKTEVTPFKIGGGGEYHGKGPKSCPTIADGRLFTVSIDGRLTARDAKTGDKIWSDPGYGKRFKSSHPYWGASASPLVDGELVFFHFGTDDEGIMVALDVATGKEVWSRTGDGPSYSSPLPADVHGVRQIIQWNHEALVGFGPKTGTELWRYPYPHLTHNQNMPTPTIHGSRILLGGENRGIVGLDLVKSGESWSVKERWHQEKLALDMSSAVMNDGLMFGMSHYDRGRLFCLDPVDGKVMWTGPPRVGNNVAFLSMPGYVLALINDGELKVIRAAGKAYEEVATYKVAPDRTWAPPVLLNDGFLIKDEQSLTRWSF